jgi:hypothetical protein
MANFFADTETARRSCFSGEICLSKSQRMLGSRDSEETFRVRRLPLCSFENDRLCGRAGPRIRRCDEHHYGRGRMSFNGREIEHAEWL